MADFVKDLPREIAKRPGYMDYMRRPSVVDPPPVEGLPEARQAIGEYLRPSSMLRRGIYPLMEGEQAPFPDVTMAEIAQGGTIMEDLLRELMGYPQVGTVGGMHRFAKLLSSGRGRRALEKQVEKGLVEKVGEGSFGGVIRPIKHAKRSKSSQPYVFKYAKRGHMGEADWSDDAIKAFRSTPGLKRSMPRLPKREGKAVTMEFKPHFSWTLGQAVGKQKVFGEGMNANEQIRLFLKWAEDLRLRFHELAAKGYVHTDAFPRNIKMSPKGHAIIIDLDPKYLQKLSPARAKAAADKVWLAAVQNAAKQAHLAPAVYQPSLFGIGSRASAVKHALDALKSKTTSPARFSQGVDFWAEVSQGKPDIRIPNLWPADIPRGGSIGAHERVMGRSPLLATKKSPVQPTGDIVKDIAKAEPMMELQPPLPTTVELGTSITSKTPVLSALKRGSPTVQSSKRWDDFMPDLRAGVQAVLENRGYVGADRIKFQNQIIGQRMASTQGQYHLPKMSSHQRTNLALKMARQWVDDWEGTPIQLQKGMGTHTRYGLKRSLEPGKHSGDFSFWPDDKLQYEIEKLANKADKDLFEMERLYMLTDEAQFRGGANVAQREYTGLEAADRARAGQEMGRRQRAYQVRGDWGFQNAPEGEWVPAPKEYGFGLQQPATPPPNMKQLDVVDEEIQKFNKSLADMIRRRGGG